MHINGKENLAQLEENLRSRVNDHLCSIGYLRTIKNELYLPEISKDIIRNLHRQKKDEILIADSKFINNAEKLKKHFASGREIDPNKIEPRLELIKTHTWQSNLFKLASLNWSVPVSSGFGRRLRFLVWDNANDKLIGLIALGDPVFNQGVRDDYIGWSGNDRSQRLVNLMDAYVLGALPPYNLLLCGKLISCIIRSAEIYRIFFDKYNTRESLVSGKFKSAKLLAVTTSSALGKSSIYNRLTLNKVRYFKKLGYSGGWGHFHIPTSIFSELRNYLTNIGHHYPTSYELDQGGNWRLRNIRTALERLGISEDLLRHGIRREVYISEFADNTIEALKDASIDPVFTNLLNIKDIAELSLDRWVLPRARRNDTFRHWSSSNFIDLIRKNYSQAEANWNQAA